MEIVLDFKLLLGSVALSGKAKQTWRAIVCDRLYLYTWLAWPKCVDQVQIGIQLNLIREQLRKLVSKLETNHYQARTALVRVVN